MQSDELIRIFEAVVVLGEAASDKMLLFTQIHTASESNIVGQLDQKFSNQ